MVQHIFYQEVYLRFYFFCRKLIVKSLFIITTVMIRFNTWGVNLLLAAQVRALIEEGVLIRDGAL